jgi:hypothetical protein
VVRIGGEFHDNQRRPCEIKISLWRDLGHEME